MAGINRLPLGYLDLVGTETGGKNPSQADENVSPVILMNELYGSQTLKPESFATNSTNVGDNNFTTVPADETWILYSISFDVISPLAGDQDTVGLFIDRLPRSAIPGATALLFVGDLLAVSNNDTPAASLMLPTPIVLHHGVRCIAQVMRRAGGAANRVVNVKMLVGALQG